MTINSKTCTFEVCGEMVPAVLNQRANNKGNPVSVCCILFWDVYHHDLDTKMLHLAIFITLIHTMKPQSVMLDSNEGALFTNVSYSVVPKDKPYRN